MKISRTHLLPGTNQVAATQGSVAEGLMLYKKQKAKLKPLQVR